MRKYARRALLVCALVTALVTTPGTPATAATPTHRWAGYEGPVAVTGIDGYIRGSGTVALPSTQFHANWINLCRSSCAQWVQLGVYQGHFGTITSLSQMHIYLENNWNGCFYESTDFGAPPSANYPYYISYTGSRFVNDCPGGGYEYEYAARKGSYTNPPIGYALMAGSSGFPFAKTELFSATSNATDVPHNTDYFGTDNNHVANGSYGIHLLMGGSWTSWTPTTEPGTAAVNYQPPTLGSTHSYWSFATH